MTKTLPKFHTMEELSVAIGISRPTLSKYFQNPESVSKTSRARIETALKGIDYTPNYFATRLNRKSTGLVGIVVPYLADPFFAEIARTIEMYCIEAGLSATLFSSHGMPEQENKILEALRSMNPAGVLLAPLGRASDRTTIERFCKEIPTVLFDSNIEGLGDAFIGSDNFKSIPAMVTYLCETHKPPCFFEMTPVNPNANKRRQAYKQAMEKLGHEPQIVRVEGTGWAFEEIGYNEGKKMICEGRLPSSTVLCSNDRLAIGLMSAAFELKLSIGREKSDDLHIAGHDDHPLSRFTNPALTTISQDYRSISRTSVETLLGLIEGGEMAPVRREVLFEGRLVVRSSA